MKFPPLLSAMLSSLLLFTPGLTRSQEGDTAVTEKPVIEANMLFLYYRDLTGAVRFYEHILGLPLVLDYGFAKAFQIARTSFVCLVDESRGMHRSEEEKTVTLSFITEEVDGWYDYLRSKNVSFHSHPKPGTDRPYRGFVARDSEGYFLEFETFQNHPENKKLLPLLDRTAALYPATTGNHARPDNLGIQGTIFWLYYKNMAPARSFYSETLGLEHLVAQAYSHIYRCSKSGYIGLVDESRGLHRFSEKKAVNVGFITPDIEGWYRFLKTAGIAMRGPLDEVENGRVRAFVAFDPAGYYLEFDFFYPCQDNEGLLQRLAGNRK